MNMEEKISRRHFIRDSVLTGGALLVGASLPAGAMSSHVFEERDEGRVFDKELL